MTLSRRAFVTSAAASAAGARAPRAVATARARAHPASGQRVHQRPVEPEGASARDRRRSSVCGRQRRRRARPGDSALPAHRPRRQDGRARLRRLPFPSGELRLSASVQRRLRSALDRRHRPSAARCCQRQACRRVGAGLQIRRHKDRRRPADDAPGPRRGVDRAPDLRQPPRRPQPPTSTVVHSSSPAIDDSTPDPPGGHFDRDARGRLTGKLEETATNRFGRLTAQERSPDNLRRGVAMISDLMTRSGVTSVTDAYGSPSTLRAYQEASAAGESSMRVYCHIGYGALDEMIEAGVRTGLGDERVRVGAVKMTCDGSISERTARLSEPYVRPRGRLRHSGHSRGAALRDRASRPCERLAARHSRQRRCCHRHVAAHLRAPAARAAARGCPTSARALHGREPEPDPAHRGDRRDSVSVLDLRLLPRREDGALRRRAAGVDVRGQELSRRRHSSDPDLRLSARAVRADDGAAVAGDPHPT